MTRVSSSTWRAPYGVLPSWQRALPAVASLLIAWGAAACSTPQKPPELVAFERLRAEPSAKQAEVVAPNVMKRADKLLAEARDHWEDNDLDDARHDSLYGQAKIKQALALLEQARAQDRIKKARRARKKADEEAAALDKELRDLKEQVSLLEQLKKQSLEREELMAELQKQRETASAEKQTLSQRLQQEKERAEASDKIMAAELAVKEAETVDAKRLASGAYQAAMDMLGRARKELEANQLDAARVSADMARQRAAAAVEAARPTYEHEVQANERRAQADALAGDAALIQSVEVRREARGQLQRLVVHIPSAILFKGRGHAIVPGSEAVLDRLADLVKKYAAFPVQLVGHTDRQGREDALLARSHARAQALYNALVARGVSASRLVASGQGAAEPVGDNRSKAGRGRNNRVEVVFLYQ